MGVALPIIAIAVTAVSGVTSAISAAKSADAQAAASNYQAQVAENQAQTAKEQAKQEAAAGEAATQQQQLTTRAKVGALKAAEAAGNVDVNSGSNVDVRSSAAELGQLDAINTRSNYAQKEYGYQAQSTSYSNSAELYRGQAESAESSKGLGIFSSLLGAASSGFGNYTKLNNVGAFGSSGSSQGAVGGSNVIF